MSPANPGWQPAIANYAGRDLRERQHWYSPAAAIYARVRPGYPAAWIERLGAIAGFSASSRLLELGCGPALATLPFARLGCQLTALEPNPDFFALAEQACAAYPQVRVQNFAFETWPLEPQRFDGVLAATSWHWIPAAVSYPKAAAALKPRGRLLLLWNKQLQPAAPLYQALQPAYDRYAPHLFRYESPAAQVEVIQDLGQVVLNSGYFDGLQTGHEWRDVTYSVEDYLALLTTYSPYLVLEPGVRTALLAELRLILQAQAGDRLDLTYLAAYHLGTKRA